MTKASTLAPLCFFLLNSCGYDSPQQSLEKVAKDWSKTVRASQVMPFYPLEEDLRPGDIYLVQNTLAEDVASWNDKGYLPMVNRFDRIHIPSSVYEQFYADGFTPAGGPSFSRAPTAAFPSYSFQTDRRGALGLAIPLSSVPLALSASGAQSASGTAVFSEATTRGLPDNRIHALVNRWVEEHLSSFSFRGNRPSTLRVVTRTFSIQKADVSLTFAKSGGGNFQLGAGAPTPGLKGTSTTDFDTLITELEKEIELTSRTSHAPATVQVVGRSEQGVSMSETFPRPLVLGYWAHEYLVTFNGDVYPLGPVTSIDDRKNCHYHARKLITQWRYAATRQDL